MALTFTRTRALVVALTGTLALCAVVVAQIPHQRARMAFSHSLPPLKGGRLEAKLVEVTYGPGESSLPHTHPCPIVGYVLEGAVRMRIGGSPEAVYHAGDAFYEDANVKHLVSANASGAERARFLAYFVCDHDAPLSTEVHDGDR